MNKNQANNINDIKQQLSLKAYVLNKYEQLKVIYFEILKL